NNGNAWWIGVAFVLELASMGSYVALFQGIHVPPGSPIRFADSYKITMASLAATRLFAAGGAGGMFLTAWSLRRSGMARSEVASRMTAFLVLLYGVYVVAMILCGVGLYTGLLPGAHPFAITVVPSIVGVVAMVAFLAVATVPERAWARLRVFAARAPQAHATGRAGRGGLMGALRHWSGRMAAAPGALSAGIRFALAKVRSPDWALFGAVSWWALNVAILYASFRAFGQAPPVAVVAEAYFVGMLANLLPLPGGVGAVEGGMIGASVALGVNGGGALIAVLTYRLFAFWLPSIPGGIAYFQLRRTVSRWQTSP
ncbi:MAG: lysylphosphatidylglycerol synthase transmembrane domain-containing protein, partial [Solirubrobacteraceae bacterium]